MSPAKVLSAVEAAGINLRLDGSDLVLEAAAPPPQAILRLLALHKQSIVAQLRLQSDAAVIPLSHSVGRHDVHDRRASIKAAHGASRPAQAGATSGGNGVSQRACESVRGQSIADSLDRLPAANDAKGHRLIMATRAFLGSPWFPRAIDCGWSLEDLFGVDARDPLDEHEQWGLVVGLAWAPQTGDCIERLDGYGAVIRFRRKTSFKEMFRVHRRFPAADGVILWWECAALRSDLE